MKKVLLAILLLAGIGMCELNAQKYYKVTVQVQKTYEYYTDADYIYKDHTSKQSGQSQIIYVCASSPEEAKREAKDECSTLCSRGWGRSLGKQNGYYVKEYREVYDASAEYVRDC
ncbi:MAG: hypothetical protein IKK36_13615 [Bacteroidales bacterium]|nr:hypothetical protein [Bacteroidales bacterium]